MLSFASELPWANRSTKRAPHRGDRNFLQETKQEPGRRKCVHQRYKSDRGVCTQYTNPICLDASRMRSSQEKSDLRHTLRDVSHIDSRDDVQGSHPAVARDQLMACLTGVQQSLTQRTRSQPPDNDAQKRTRDTANVNSRSSSGHVPPSRAVPYDSSQCSFCMAMLSLS